MHFRPCGSAPPGDLEESYGSASAPVNSFPGSLETGSRVFSLSVSQAIEESEMDQKALAAGLDKQLFISHRLS